MRCWLRAVAGAQGAVPGLPKDMAASVHFLEAAAAQRHPAAAFLLAMMYLAGEHVPRDSKRAYTLLVVAAEEARSRRRSLGRPAPGWPIASHAHA